MGAAVALSLHGNTLPGSGEISPGKSSHFPVATVSAGKAEGPVGQTADCLEKMRSGERACLRCQTAAERRGTGGAQTITGQHLEQRERERERKKETQTERKRQRQRRRE